jgi:hypothetical protein
MNKNYICLPQPPQNFVPGGLSKPQALHLPLAGCERLLPQLLQNFTACAFSAPHFEHFFNPSDAPQLLQNFPVPAGFPQFGHMVVFCVNSPLQTVAVADLSSIFLFIACE